MGVIKLQVVERSTGELVEEIDVSDLTESGQRQVRMGLLMQMNRTDYRLQEVTG